MADYDPIEVRGFFRSHTHLPLWEVIDKGGIWKQLNMKVSFEFCGSSGIAEGSLFDGSVGFISGNHITPYALVGRGKPIVCLASPSNSVNDRLVSRQPISSVSGLKGEKIGDTTLEDAKGGYHHLRGNHMLYVLRGGLRLDDVNWIEVTESMDEFRTAQFESMQSGKVDATFVTGDTDAYEKAGFHVLTLEPLPMITGPTLTTCMQALKSKDCLPERLVKALVLGIHFVRTRKKETEEIFRQLKEREPKVGNVNYNRVAKMPIKPYPEPHAVLNAYELCRMKIPETKEVSALALWDTHILRELDDSGFIDGLYR